MHADEEKVGRGPQHDGNALCLLDWVVATQVICKRDPLSLSTGDIWALYYASRSPNKNRRICTMGIYRIR